MGRKEKPKSRLFLNEFELLAIHAENNEIIQRLTNKVEKSGRRDYNALLEGRPNLAEEMTIQTGIALAKELGTRLHILHVSTEEGVKLVSQAKKRTINSYFRNMPTLSL